MLLYVVLQSPISAQLTIGSATEPLSGVLLDIKNTADGYSDKGLLLPRVQLKDRKSLTPLLTESGAMNADSLAYHRGLTVYNLTKSDNLCPGVYTWNGKSWVGLLPMKGNVYRGDPESNSFIVPINTTIDIPVEKAYRAWREFETPRNAIPFFNRDLNDLYPGVLKAVLLWEDRPGLIANASPIDNKLYLLKNAEIGNVSAIIGNGQDACIRVEPRLDECDTIGGNAVVALTIDDQVYWSWHIWYTNYNPNQIIDTLSFGAYKVKQGEIYEYDNRLSDKTTIFMDRNLGALSSTPGDERTIGLVYQWGRKDPYPGPAYFKKVNAPQKIYDAMNGDTPINNKIVTEKLGPIVLMNLPNAINNPMTIYTSSQIRDWLSSGSLTSMTELGYNMTFQNNYLWDNQGQKTYFDPCPQGWRVPHCSVWFNPQAIFVDQNNGFWSSESYFSSAINPINYGASFNEGWIFNNPNYNIGYYPLTQVGETLRYHVSNTPSPFDSNGKLWNGVLNTTMLILTINEMKQSRYGRETLGALRCVHE